MNPYEHINVLTSENERLRKALKKVMEKDGQGLDGSPPGENYYIARKALAKKRILIDFDGVLHSYVSGWSLIPKDEPVPGAKEFVEFLLSAGFEVMIFTARLHNAQDKQESIIGIHQWLNQHKFPLISVTGEKLNADLYIDDRGYRFTGDFEDLRNRILSDELLESWTKKNSIDLKQTTFIQTTFTGGVVTCKCKRFDCILCNTRTY